MYTPTLTHPPPTEEDDEEDDEEEAEPGFENMVDRGTKYFVVSVHNPLYLVSF